ncbi:GAF domain-containing protein [Paenibacillus psychroresistens]|uniref:GAF domain-containing protein n=1 Tax=Paenibacillus psychroresistens TaxID=1778678 RepID=A0A6B8RSC1_9BACL|nr:GAF domain-containing protein [Paenibacillus psychroresistens]QGQ98714.1 GAF domain-containing protein [Paenibacillus psychroresistens]
MAWWNEVRQMIYPSMEENVDQEIQQELDSLCKITTSDFSGLAWIDLQDSRIRWLYVSGNTNERYKRLAQKLGRGLAGLVMKLGRPIIIDAVMNEKELSRLQHDYPIMLVEHLHTALAVPIKLQDETRAVLLIGNRSDRYYEDNDLHLVSNLIDRFEQLLQ